MAVDEATGKERLVEHQVHQRNYVAFTRLLKWSAIVAFIVAYLIMLIISD